MIQERNFYIESYESREQPPQGRGRVPITEGFQDVIVSSRLPFP